MKDNPKNSLPHNGVFTRLGVSQIHGVGVFAIKKIKKNTLIFWGDNEPILWVEFNKIKNVTRPIMELYKDFAIIKNKKYGCPPNFNLLTVSWYINHSNSPNVKCDLDYNFYSIRNIKVGEELTVDYSTYSE
jgi:SET domain-containing protein